MRQQFVVSSHTYIAFGASNDDGSNALRIDSDLKVRSVSHWIDDHHYPQVLFATSDTNIFNTCKLCLVDL